MHIWLKSQSKKLRHSLPGLPTETVKIWSWIMSTTHVNITVKTHFVRTDQRSFRICQAYYIFSHTDSLRPSNTAWAVRTTVSCKRDLCRNHRQPGIRWSGGIACGNRPCMGMGSRYPFRKLFLDTGSPLPCIRSSCRRSFWGNISRSRCRWNRLYIRQSHLNILPAKTRPQQEKK